VRISQFVDFVRREANGSCWGDPTYRAYDLDRGTGQALLTRALRSLGYSTIQELRSDLVAVGYLGPVQAPVARWYVWELIRRGDYKKWPRRKERRGQAGGGEAGLPTP
jgi:hypothetical protein